jgi:serine/threonine protein kinase
MGRVWRATDLRLLEPVAIKLLDPAGLEADGARERFFREAQAAARLRGPNVVQVLDFDVDPATQIPYLAMELLHGEDLAERLARGPLPFPATVAILADVCSAITKAHRLEIVHRDLKPANIFIVDGDDGPVCKVLDFGIVKLTTPSLDKPGLTLSGATLGTVSYMSPEQIADAQRVDHRADLWSLGVLAYECLTGRRPFRGDSLLGLVHEVCYGTPTPPSRLAEVPPGFDRWFSRATHRDRDRRFASARELLDALKALDRPTATTTATQSEPHREPAQSWVSDANQIDIGALKDLTFKSPVVREFLDGASRHFVSGSKGLGKTLLLTYKRALLSEQYQVANPAQSSTTRDRRQSVQFIPEGRPYLDLMGDLPSVDHSQIERMSRLDECKRLWNFSFRLAILSYHPSLLGDPEDLSPLPRRLRALLEGRPVEPTLVLKELLALSVRQLSQTLDAMEGPLERRLRALHSGVFIFIDKLDQALRRLPRAAWVHMQAGMIEAAWDLMNANRHVKVFATIREEAFSGYESDIKTNLYGATSSLRYAKHELRELLEKLTYYYEGLPLYDFVLFDQVHASPGARGESPFDLLHRHTLGRPRDLVILASEVSRHRRGLDARALIRVVQDTSAGLLVSNIFDEMRVFLEVLSDRDRRARFLALLPHDVLTHDDVAAVWCAFHGVDRDYFDLHGRDADDVYHPFRELYECGLLGVLEPGGAQRFRQPHDPVAGSRHELPRSTYYLLHPALRALLERLAGAGRFRPLRHILVGHGEPWPAHWNLLVDVQRELLRRAPRRRHPRRGARPPRPPLRPPRQRRRPRVRPPRARRHPRLHPPHRPARARRPGRPLPHPRRPLHPPPPRPRTQHHPAKPPPPQRVPRPRRDPGPHRPRRGRHAPGRHRPLHPPGPRPRRHQLRRPPPRHPQRPAQRPVPALHQRHRRRLPRGLHHRRPGPRRRPRPCAPRSTTPATSASSSTAAPSASATRTSSAPRSTACFASRPSRRPTAPTPATAPRSAPAASPSPHPAPRRPPRARPRRLHPRRHVPPQGIRRARGGVGRIRRCRHSCPRMTWIFALIRSRRQR